MPRFEQDGAGVAPMNEAIADGAFTAVPAGTANGAPLTGRPTGATGVMLYLPAGTDMTYTIATSAPGGAPTLVSQVTSVDKVVYEPLGPNSNIYVTIRTGAPFYRWI